MTRAVLIWLRDSSSVLENPGLYAERWPGTNTRCLLTKIVIQNGGEKLAARFRRWKGEW